MTARVNLEDLDMAVQWLGAAETAGSQADAFVSRATGRIFWRGEGVEDEELPEDLEDEEKYVPVPSRHDFDLGKALVMRFVRERLPDAYDHVRDIFSRRGAYSRYKDFLDRAGMLDAWHAYEDRARQQALREWCDENDLPVLQPAEAAPEVVAAGQAAPAAAARRGGAMRPSITLITLAVDDLERAVRFYRDGLGLPTRGIVGQEFEHGSVAFFDLDGGLRLALWPRRSLCADTGLPAGPRSPGESCLAHNVGSKEEVDEVIALAARAGATVVKPAQDTFWGGYAGYFLDPDQHLWEVAWNPDWMLAEGAAP